MREQLSRAGVKLRTRVATRWRIRPAGANRSKVLSNLTRTLICSDTCQYERHTLSTLYNLKLPILWPVNGEYEISLDSY